MNLKLIALFFLLLSVHVSAQTNLQIYVPGIQWRFEESSDQATDIRDYTHYAAHLMYDKILTGIEYNTFEDSSGNTSLNVKSTVKEWNVILGYSLLKYEFQNVTSNTNIELIAEGFVGKNKTVVKTSLLGSEQTDESEEQSVLGAGGVMLFRIDYFIAALDSRWMQSNAYTPNSISVTTFKLGVNFWF